MKIPRFSNSGENIVLISLRCFVKIDCGIDLMLSQNVGIYCPRATLTTHLSLINWDFYVTCTP